MDNFEKCHGFLHGDGYKDWEISTCVIFHSNFITAQRETYNKNTRGSLKELYDYVR